jgi:hypothetical protein
MGPLKCQATIAANIVWEKLGWKDDIIQKLQP